jgi:hypothetical protein
VAPARPGKRYNPVTHFALGMTDPPPHAPAPLPPPLIPYAAEGFETPYASARPRARLIVWVAWATIVVELLMVPPTIHHFLSWHAYVHEYEYGTWDVALLDEDWTVSVVVAWGLWLIDLVLNVGLMVRWLMWVHRTYRNLRPPARPV